MIFFPHRGTYHCWSGTDFWPQSFVLHNSPLNLRIYVIMSAIDLDTRLALLKDELSISKCSRPLFWGFWTRWRERCPFFNTRAATWSAGNCCCLETKSKVRGGSHVRWCGVTTHLEFNQTVTPPKFSQAKLWNSLMLNVSKL